MFCIKCGKVLREGAKFCDNCGTPVVVELEPNSQKTQYAGKVYKCPKCGEVLDAFMSECPSCGYELRGINTTDSIKAFAEQLEKAKDEEEMTSIIRLFPIPNTKEDVLEFMIIASSNITQGIGGVVSEAWRIKLDQIMQKAKLVFEDSEELANIEKQYLVIKRKLTNGKIIKASKDTLTELMPIMPRLVVVFGWLLSIFVLIPLSYTPNNGASGMQILLMIDLVLGGFMVPSVLDCEEPLPKLLTASGMLLSVIVLIALGSKSDGFSPYHLIMFVDIVSCAIMLAKVKEKDGNILSKIGNTSLSSIVVTVVCIFILFVVYVLGNITVAKTLEAASKKKAETIALNIDKANSARIHTYSVRNYVGKNAGSIGDKLGSKLYDEYGAGYLWIVFVTEDGIAINLDDETKKQYAVVQQNIPPGTTLRNTHELDSDGKPYEGLVEHQNYEEIVLYVAPVGDSSYQPEYIEINPSTDRYTYYIRDYTGRNATSCGERYGNKRMDEYGCGTLDIAFSAEDGSYVDVSDDEILKKYVVVAQDILPNTELKLEYLTNSDGEEYNHLVKNQNYDRITLTVRRLDDQSINQMPIITEGDTADSEEVSDDGETSDNEVNTSGNNKTVRFGIDYNILYNGKAEVIGLTGVGNYATIYSEIDGHKVTRISDSAFKDCNTLEKITFLADIEHIGDYAFSGCSSLKSINIPSSTKYIGQHAFEGCSNLSSAIIFGNPSISDYAFSGCSSLKSISISTGTKSIGKHAFDGCSGLKSVILFGDPDIDDYAFAGCTSLTSITIGSDVSKIGSHAFDGCTSLSSVILFGDNTIIAEDAFVNCPALKDNPVQ